MTGNTTYDFAGQVVVITGGGTGIGKGIGDAFARAGATVVVTGRRLEPLEAFKAQHGKHGDFIQMDVGIDADRRRTMDEVIARHGRLDVLINNALSIYSEAFEDLSVEQIESMYRILLVAPTILTQTALPHLVKTQGSVINISSVVAQHVAFPGAGSAIYATAKAGVSHLTRTLANELGPKGVRVNAIAPGATRSETSPAYEESFKAIAAITPMGRVAEPEDISAVALFLASKEAGWVTGQVVGASGGWGISG